MNAHEKIAFLDLVSPHQELENELVPIFKKVLSTAGFIGGPMVQEFESGFAEFCDAAHCIGVASGTDALRFALIASGVQPGDVVITVPNTFIATTEAISQVGARPDFVDVDERTYNLDPIKLEEYLRAECYLDRVSDRLFHKSLNAPVTAVIPVHLYGQTADMDAILDLARMYKLIVIEDACQAHGAEYFSKKENRWRKAGSMGDAAAFSFYPGKNLGACGEAGAVTTNNEEIASKVRKLRDHGQAKKYYHDIEGYNGRLDALQAGLLAAKLRHLSEWNQKRKIAAGRYDEVFASVEGIGLPYRPDWSRPVYHLYVIRVRDRIGLQKHLAAAKIDTGIHYPVPLHLQKAYQAFGYKAGDFPITEQAASEILSLPMFPQLTAAQQSRVVDEIVCFLQREMLPGKVNAGFASLEVRQGTT
jgi:dTDP-4-amino-4,6-dideoxygalactose transaminase